MTDSTSSLPFFIQTPDVAQNEQMVSNSFQTRINGVVNPRLDFEPDIVAPGIWRFPTNLEHCCIYRVPNRLRKINPEAYTSQSIIIGPLHHALKVEALRSIGNISNTKFMGYLNMEQHKKIYLAALVQRVEDKKIINGLRNMIKENEEIIRASYSESTIWIESQEFVEMFLHDSVFILEYILRYHYRGASSNKTGDVLMDEACVESTIREDLILLENQLPYFILEKLFDPIVKRLHPTHTFRKLIITYFGFEGNINDNSKFRHFTDLFRCVRVETLKLEEPKVALWKRESIEVMYNADKLASAGVKFEAINEMFSLEIRFEKGCLKIPCFLVQDSSEMLLRNIMAFEQCHYPHNAYVCNFVIFLDHLIDTNKDVDFLADKGIIKNWIGDNGSVTEMMNKLSLGVIDFGSYYDEMAFKIKAHYENSFNRSRDVLKRVYFNDPWTGTATVATVVLLLMTLIQTVASILQVTHK